VGVLSRRRIDRLPDIAAKIGAELRNQYVLGYYPSNRTRDARWRKIKIKQRTSESFSPSQRLRKNRLLSACPLRLANLRSTLNIRNL
jgi:hypothetical protein